MYRVRVMTYNFNSSGRRPSDSKCYSLVSLQPLFWSVWLWPHPSAAQYGNQEAHFIAAAGLMRTCTVSGLPFFCLVWFRQFPCETLPWSNIVISHRGPGFSGYCLSALSGPATHIAQLPPPRPSPASCSKFDCDPWRSTLANGRGSSMSAPSNNLIKAGRGIHEETKCWLLWLQLWHQLAF